MILPVTINILTTWAEITAQIRRVKINEKNTFEIESITNDYIEIIITTSDEVIDSSYNLKGALIHAFNKKTFIFQNAMRYYIRSIDTQAQARIMNMQNDDIFTHPFSQYFNRPTGVQTTLSADLSSGSTAISIASATGFVVGQNISIKNTHEETTFPRITAITGTLIALDRPIDMPFTTGDLVAVVNTNMAQSGGTLEAPLSYKIIPRPNQSWDLKTLILSMTHNSAGSMDLFGNLAPLTNGVVIRAYSGRSGGFFTFTNWKANQDIKDDIYQVTFDERAPSTSYGTSGKGELEGNTGAIPRINGADGDYMEILIQDNLSGLISFRIKAQGRIAEL